MQTPSNILSGIKVLDLTRMVAGPLCTQTLADLGAIVYKIERPGLGDDTRRFGPFLKDAEGQDTNDSAYYLAYNRSKKSITVDITTNEGRLLILDLARQCDVIVENYKAGSLEKYGLAYHQVVEYAPDIIYCTVSGFGPDGPYAKRPAYDSITQGMAGLMSTNGQPDGSPGAEALRTAVPITDVSTGLYASTAIVGALFHRQRTGEGRHIDVSLFDSSVVMNGHLAIEYLVSNRAPTRVGNANPSSAPSEVFACVDGPVMIAAGNDAQFSKLCDALGLLDPTMRARYKSNSARTSRRQELHDQIESKTRHFSRQELVDLLSREGVPIGKILEMDEVFEDPQVLHREMVVHLPHGRGGKVPVLKSPIRMKGMSATPDCPPMLGEDTTQVLADELNMSPEHIERLRSAGII